jgi:hypothetical protein
MNLANNMKRFETLVLLQHLAEKLDTGQGTLLEQQSYDCIMEILNEDIKNRSNSADNSDSN